MDFNEKILWGQAVTRITTAVNLDGAMRGRAAVPSAAARRQDGGSPSGQAAPAGALVATIMGNGIYGRLSRVSRLGTYANDAIRC